MNVAVSELVFNPLSGRDELVRKELNFDPAKYPKGTSRGHVAAEFRKALIEWAVKNYGFSRELAESEISLFDPNRTVSYSGSHEWCVVWESGPFEWAIAMSMELRGEWGYCEPYYSFDLHFTH